MTERQQYPRACAQPYCVYIHVPFCARKCAYCDFFSIPCAGEARRLVKEWFDIIRREMLLWADLDDPNRSRPITTVYIGGGTPSLADDETIWAFLNFVRSEFQVEPRVEITIEMRPGTASGQVIEGYARAGVTRFSVGVQTFNQSLLDSAGRGHTVQQSHDMLRQTAQAGIVSADLISGWPGQTFEQWKADLSEMLSFNPPHISAYEMTFHTGTPFGDRIHNGSIRPHDEECRIAFFEETSRMLARAGYEHYEISNYSCPGLRSRHNENYWKLGDYIGFGAGAHSFVFPHRYLNDNDIERYASTIRAGRLFRRLSDSADHDLFILENLQMALRLTDGADLDLFANRFGMDVRVACADKLAVLIEQGLAQLSDSRMKLTMSGMMRMDSIIEYLL
ncbi:MAG: radical SAM family heme chaperone HemW [Candidatus Sumerlaeota bacterium]|nr:radical SAM family heme chaperone HemW [Candidatus Sumerlaeota bacterium]